MVSKKFVYKGEAVSKVPGSFFYLESYMVLKNQITIVNKF